MTPPKGAGAILNERTKLDSVVDALGERAQSHADMPAAEQEQLRQRVRERSLDLLDEWSKIAMELQEVGAELQYQTEEGRAKRLLYEFLNPELKQLHPRHKKFRANRSMRDVEANVNLWLKTADGTDVEEDDQ